MHKSILLLIVTALFFLAGCVRHVTPVGVSVKAPPGQVQKATGYNPASGKLKAK